MEIPNVGTSEQKADFYKYYLNLKSDNQNLMLWERDDSIINFQYLSEKISDHLCAISAFISVYIDYDYSPWLEHSETKELLGLFDFVLQRYTRAHSKEYGETYVNFFTMGDTVKSALYKYAILQAKA